MNQKVVVENVQTNGYIYAHSAVEAVTNMEHENAGTFEVRNCTCDWIGVYGNGDAVRKHCVFEDNKCHFIKIAFIDNFNLGFMCWDVTLKNNHTDFIACQLFKYGDTTTMKRLVDNYYGTFPFADPNLHNVIHNTTGADIVFGSKLKYTDYTRR